MAAAFPPLAPGYFSAAQGEDPYGLLLQTVLPGEAPPALHSITVSFGILFGIAFCICGLVSIYPAFSTPTGRKNDVWLLRRCHTTHSTASMPYLVLNGGLVLAICQTVGCFLFEIFIVLSFLAYKNPQGMYEPYQAFIQITMWLPGFCGFLGSAFNALYVCISAADTEPRTFPQKPASYNTLLIIIPLYAILQAISWSTAAFTVIYKERKAFDNLSKLLMKASIQWNKSSSSDGLEAMNSEILIVYKRVEDLISKKICIRYGSTISWLPLSFGLLLLYVYTSFSLLVLMKRLSTSSTTKIDSTKKSGDKRFPMSFIPHLSATPNDSIIQIQTTYRFLLWHCIFMSFCIIWDAGVGILFLCPVPSKMTASDWQLLVESICLGGGFFLPIGMSFQSWRIMSEGRRKPTIL